jgi:transposase-like protein
MANEIVLLTQWRERLKRHSESGLTVETFCQQEGVSTSMFYRWQRQLQARSSGPTPSQSAGRAKPARKQRGKPSSRQRPEVATTGGPATEHPSEFLRLPVRGVRSMPWIELMLVDGTVVRIPQENHAALALVLRTLRSEGNGERFAEARHA